ncbi:DUF3147 family protein [Rufibacter sp. LB8]|uniref:DUF3147 family protein n=1 Tax=Rufibacter sp. LB8 TaxID=2777781 RepID=UPI00178C173C|nr:DUF3147 family protein [Rufibacter sp. LB8]
MQILFKVIITALLITGISELGRRYSTAAAVLAALPITSILAMVWLYVDTKDTGKISDLSYGIFWAVLPSLLFFIALPLLLKAGLKFPLAMLLSCVLMAGFYYIYVLFLRKLGIQAL